MTTTGFRFKRKAGIRNASEPFLLQEILPKQRALPSPCDLKALFVTHWTGPFSYAPTEQKHYFKKGSPYNPVYRQLHGSLQCGQHFQWCRSKMLAKTITIFQALALLQHNNLSFIILFFSSEFIIEPLFTIRRIHQLKNTISASNVIKLRSPSFRASAHTGVGIRFPYEKRTDRHTSLRTGSQ